MPIINRVFFITLAALFYTTTCFGQQNMLRKTRQEVLDNYKKSGFCESWTDSKTSDGTPRVTYFDKRSKINVCCIFIEGYCCRFLMVGPRNEANTFGTYFNEHYTKVNDLTWMDYSIPCKWIMKFSDDGFVILQADNIPDEN